MVVSIAPGLGQPRPKRQGEARGVHLYEIEEKCLRIETYIWRDTDWALTAERRFPRGRETLESEALDPGWTGAATPEGSTHERNEDDRDDDTDDERKPSTRDKGRDDHRDDSNGDGEQPAHGVRPRMEEPAECAHDRSYDDEPYEVHGA